MTKTPTEMQIPDDVARAASKAYDAPINDHGASLVSLVSKVSEDYVKIAIARAIMAERERCARICDSKMYDFGCIAGTEAQDFVTLCADLAMEIRSVDK